VLMPLHHGLVIGAGQEERTQARIHCSSSSLPRSDAEIPSAQASSTAFDTHAW
jgi:hypothetical protein